MIKEAIIKISSLNHIENTIQATLEINKNSEIFIGHFAGHPVLPGACMLQIVKEVLQSAFSSNFRLKKADYIKFLRLIDPGIDPSLELKLTYQLTDEKVMDVLVVVMAQHNRCFKFKGTFVPC